MGNLVARYSILEAPSILGLKPSGVEYLSEALLGAGLERSLGASRAGRIETLPYCSRLDPTLRLLNPEGIRDYSIRLSDSVGLIVDRGEFPIVLGGDCSILLGSMLALRKRGRYGLLFLDGHMDFYSPDTSPTGEAADMDLALVTGRGPDVVSDIQGLRPLVLDEDTVVLGYRDEDDVARDGGAMLSSTAMLAIGLPIVRTLGSEQASNIALRRLQRDELAGFWIHLDVDVLDDEVMPAVDYRMPGGLSYEELSTILRNAIGSGRAVGLEITVYNPKLDPGGIGARLLVECLQDGLRPIATR